MWDKQKYKGKLTRDVPLGARTWFRAGGSAEYFFAPHDEEDIQVFLSCYPTDAPLYVLGVGSNTLVRDGGVKGVVMVLPFQHIERLGESLRVGSAVLAQKVSQVALEAELTGFEFMRGIPGSVGGCLAMNAGAYGSDTSAIFMEAVAFDRQGKKRVLKQEQMAFGYRTALSGHIFMEALFAGARADKKAIEEKMAAVMASRQVAQPSGARTSGSTFKNPTSGKKAWELIEESGCRCFSVGDAVVNEKHCNFLMNRGKARACDIEALGEKIREAVKVQTGIELEWEIQRIGEKQ